ncbi:hypothetical protein B566_EDAN016766 [Ephemera danica]|nr:hypothetical protein B566_EDAN016766 [Ephemera danica]
MYVQFNFSYNTCPAAVNMAQLNNAAFSPDGQYFAFYHSDGKLKIWDTVAGILKQEYTPNEHLTLQCSALAWVALPHLKNSPGKKKKHRHNEEEGGVSSRLLLLGLTSGCVLLYSLSTGTVEGELQGLNLAVKSVTWTKSNEVYGGYADGTIAHWTLPAKNIASKWQASKGPITALLAHTSQPWLLSASQKVIMWDCNTKEKLKCFSGHASYIFRLLLVPGGNYFVSVASGDRHINVWSMESSSSQKDLAASFVLPDQPTFVDVAGTEENARLVAITKGGALHSFSQHINGKRHPPIKPQLTVQIASSTEVEDMSAVECIPILGALVSQDDSGTVHIAHGNSAVLRFEKLNASVSKEVMWLVRQPPRKTLQEQSTSSKVKTAESNEKAHYVTAAGVKRPRDIGSAKQLPIEQRISNLSGLQSSDQKLLRGILLNKDNRAVTSTISCLTPSAVPMLLQELAVLVHWRGWKGEAATRWLHSLLVHHGAQVLASPELPQLLSPLLGLVEARLAQVAPLARLRGRLSLLLGQLAHGCTAKNKPYTTPTPDEELQAVLLHYRDDEGSSNEFGLDSDSDWADNSRGVADDEDTDDDDEEAPMVNGDDAASDQEEMELSS